MIITIIALTIMSCTNGSFSSDHKVIEKGNEEKAEIEYAFNEFVNSIKDDKPDMILKHVSEQFLNDLDNLAKKSQTLKSENHNDYFIWEANIMVNLKSLFHQEELKNTSKKVIAAKLIDFMKLDFIENAQLRHFKLINEHMATGISSLKNSQINIVFNKEEEVWKVNLIPSDEFMKYEEEKLLALVNKSKKEYMDSYIKIFKL
jgi:hypothetical protein